MCVRYMCVLCGHASCDALDPLPGVAPWPCMQPYIPYIHCQEFGHALVCLRCMPCMYASYVCLICTPGTCALCLCLKRIPNMYSSLTMPAVTPCPYVYTCPYVYALYVCLICLPSMCALYTCLTYAVRRRAMPDPHKNPTQLGPAWRLVGAASAGPAALKATARDEYHRRSGMCACRESMLLVICALPFGGCCVEVYAMLYRLIHIYLMGILPDLCISNVRGFHRFKRYKVTIRIWSKVSMIRHMSPG